MDINFKFEQVELSTITFDNDRVFEFNAKDMELLANATALMEKIGTAEKMDTTNVKLFGEFLKDVKQQFIDTFGANSEKIIFGDISMFTKTKTGFAIIDFLSYLINFMSKEMEIEKQERKSRYIKPKATTKPRAKKTV